MSFENFPYSNFHELNLDWIVQKIKEAYSPDNPPENIVLSINGQTGHVELFTDNFIRLPDVTENAWNIFRIADDEAKGIQFDGDGAYRIYRDQRYKIYDEDNEPDYPVTSVNGQTGDVVITVPPQAVRSVNGKVGSVITPFMNPNSDILKLDSNSNTALWGLSRDVVGGNASIYITTAGNSPQAYIRFIPTNGEAVNLPLLTNIDIPESAGVLSVNTKTGAVTLYGTDMQMSVSDSTTITSAIRSETSIREDSDKNLQIAIDGVFLSTMSADAGDTITWAVGSIRGNTGANYGSNQFLRTVEYISNKYDIITYLNTPMKFLLYAYDSNDEYVGLLHNDYTFSPVSSISNYGVDTINLSIARKKYPNYKYRVVCTFYPSQTMNPSMSEYVGLYYAKSNESDITTIEGKITDIEQDIESLQNTDNTHDQQITALQNVNTNQSQQITELQNSYNGHSQQIAELQNEISVIETGTSIKEINITDITVMPCRYPETGTDDTITSTMKCMLMELSRPGVQHSNWTIETFDGYLTIAGTIRGLTDITLYLI